MTIRASMMTSIKAPLKDMTASMPATPSGDPMGKTATAVREVNCRSPMMTSQDFLREPQIGIVSAMIP